MVELEKECKILPLIPMLMMRVSYRKKLILKTDCFDIFLDNINECIVFE